MALMISLVSSGSALTAYATEMVPGTEAVVENGISTEGESLWDGVTFENQIQTERGLVTYSLTNIWEGGFSANITILNNCETVINKWELGMRTFF